VTLVTVLRVGRSRDREEARELMDFASGNPDDCDTFSKSI